MSTLLRIIIVVYWSYSSVFVHAAPLDQVAPELHSGPALFTWKPKANHFNYDKISPPSKVEGFNNGYLEKEPLQRPFDSIVDAIDDLCSGKMGYRNPGC